MSLSKMILTTTLSLVVKDVIHGFLFASTLIVLEGQLFYVFHYYIEIYFNYKLENAINQVQTWTKTMIVYDLYEKGTLLRFH